MIANTLHEKLPHNVSFYTQEALVQYGLPSFLVKRVAHHVYLQIIKKIVLPDQDWLARDSDRMVEAWLELTGAIKDEVRVPADHIEEFLKEAVRDCLRLTLYPRKTILKFLFAKEKELNISAITERAVPITVNRYLVWSLIRYMEKKEKMVINRAQADSILAKIDEKVVENYHPLNWLALVKPLYELCGPNVPSRLLRLFFEDKKQQPASREFDLMDREISETEFIEVLSSPGLLYVEGYKDDQQSLFESAEDVFEDPLNQKFMNKTDDLPEILPVDDEADLPDPIVTEDDKKSGFDVEQAAPWDEDESESDPEEESDSALSDLYLDPDQDHNHDEQEDILEIAYLDDEDDRLEITAVDEDTDEDHLNSSFVDKFENHFEKDVVEKEEHFETADLDEDEDHIESTVMDEEADHLEKTVLDQDGSDEEQVNPVDSEISDSEEFPEEEPKIKTVEPDKRRSEISIEAIEIDESEDEPEPESDSESDQADEITEEDETAGEETLASRFIFDDEEDSEIKIEPDLDEPTTIYDELNLSRKGAEPSNHNLFSTPETDSFDVTQQSEPDIHLSDLKNEEEVEDEAGIEKHETDAEPPLFVDESDFDELEEEEQDEADLPMWRSFLEREDVENSSSFQFDDSKYDVKSEDLDEEEDDKNAQDGTAFDDDSELLDEDGFIAEPIYDLTREDEPIDQKIGELNEWLLDEKDRFIEGIFGDSEDAYEEALADIIEYEDWKSASRYIEKEIFTRNRIDVYDEIAVDFTDRLHSYFLENK